MHQRLQLTTIPTGFHPLFPENDMAMKYNQLGRTDIEVSAICLGSMTWGTQNTEQEAHDQIDLAMEHGVNLIDTAEMYPTTPLGAETQGRTEEYIGTWLKKGGHSKDMLIATKVTGVGNQSYIHDGMKICTEKIRLSLESSLKRLQTDCIDLYQLHWPNRGSYHFRQNFTYDPTKQNTGETFEHIEEVLTALQGYVDQGKIRTIGLSNESSWGTMQFLRIASEKNLPRVVSVQNEYNLLNRLFDLDLAELSHHEQVGLLAFSPLAAGLLTGKYRDGQVPAGSRRTLNDTLNGRYCEHSKPALDAYIGIADKHNIPPSQLALAFCIARPFMTSAIVGATSIEHLTVNLGAADLELNEQLSSDIADVYRRYPVPI